MSDFASAISVPPLMFTVAMPYAPLTLMAAQSSPPVPSPQVAGATCAFTGNQGCTFHIQSASLDAYTSCGTINLAATDGRCAGFGADRLHSQQ